MNAKTLITLTGLLGAAALFTTIDATAGTVAAGTPAVATPSAGAKIPLQCTGAAQSDVARIHIFKNTGTVTIPKGKKIYYSNQYGQSSNVTLSANLLPGQTASHATSGGTNGGFSCNAHVYAGHPDLAITSARWVSSTQVEVYYKNLNPLAAAVGAKVELKAANCGGDVAQGVLMNVPTISGTRARRVVYNFAKPANATFFWAKANATGSMYEVNKLNNRLKSSEWALTCAPR